MPHGFADTTKTKTYRDDGAWITLRTSFTKHDQDVLGEAQQTLAVESEGRVELRARIVEGNRTAFALLCTDWWLREAEGAEPSAESYDKLALNTGRWIDECLNEAVGIAREEVGKAEPSPRRRKSSRASSPAGGGRASSD